MTLTASTVEDREQIRTTRENEALSDIFLRNILGHNCFMFKCSMTESSQ